MPTRRAVLAASALALPAAARAQPRASMPLIELRRYRTNPGRRDELIALFEQQFVESQEAVGMTLIGTFREPGFDDRFTWMRGFADMAARERGLNAFYSGAVWRAHREAANACLFDNDDVWLLREARPGAGLAPANTPRPPVGQPLTPRPPITATIQRLPAATAEAAALARLDQTRPQRLGAYVREKAANSFPRLPVHEDAEALVWFEAGLTDTPSAEVLHLVPTARSGLQG